MELLTYVSLPLNIQLKFAGGTESAVHCKVTLWPGAAADGPVMDTLYGPSTQRECQKYIRMIWNIWFFDCKCQKKTIFILK